MTSADNYHHRGMRRRLIEELRQRNIGNERVRSVMGQLPRHLFLDKAFEEKAYDDTPFPIACDQTISQPSTVAFQTAALEVLPRQRVLEIGTGSGYQAAVLGLLGARVFTVERHRPLYQKARQMMRRLRIKNVRCFLRDGFHGLPEFAPYDRIIVTAGAEEIPQTLREQLAVGGILIIPVGKESQRMYRLRKTGLEEFETEDLGDFRFVPFLPGMGE